MLCLPLLISLTAPNEAYAQTSCNVSDAITSARGAYDHHRINGSGRASSTAVAAYRVLITIDPDNLPVWEGSNISVRPAPTITITEAQLRDYLTSSSVNDTWDGWNAVYTALSCLENNVPIVDNAIPDQAAGSGAAFSYTFPAATFRDPDGDNLTYTATKSDDTTLPTWLSFDANTRTFSGTPQSSEIGTLSVKVTADDGRSGTVSDTFDIEVVSVLVSISAPADADEGNSGTADKFFTITLSSAASAPVPLRICNSGTATLGTSDDYIRLNGSLTSTNTCDNIGVIAGNTTNNNIGIRVRGDTDLEFHETVVATLSFNGTPPAGVTLGTSVATYTIQDDDNTNSPPVPSVPTGFTATAGDGEVTLSWNAFSGPFTRLQYRQKAGSGDYGNFITIIGGASGTITSYTVTGLTNGTTYTFQLETLTINAQGSIASVPSDEASATPATANTPVISVSLPTAEGSRTPAGEGIIAESEGATGIGFNLAADRPLTSDLTVCVRVTESGGDRVTSTNEGVQTADMPSSVINGSGTYTLRWTNTATDDRDSSVTVEVVGPNTAGCPSASDAYTVSSSEASDKLLIQDDEATTVSLTPDADITMTEGDASDTATFTVSLSRQLYAGETIGVPIELTTGTGARLPGSVDGSTVANHDFTVSAGGTLVTLATDAPPATPRVVFTGHHALTVQDATVTLTPVANRDDGDTAHETITATLTSVGQVDTTVSGGATAHAMDNAATLILEDDDPPPAVTCSAQNGIFSETNLRILETGETTYCVRLTRPPSGGDTIGTTGSYQGSVTFSPSSLTFTPSNYQTPQQVTVTGVDQPSLHLNRTLSLTHTANGGNYTNWSLGTVMVNVDDAPELEAWDLAVWNANNFVAKQRPNTVKATRGFRYFQNDMTPVYPLRYQLRLSNRPASGETVTVTATSSDFNKFGLSLTSGGTPQASLTVTFEDRPADRVCFNGGHSSLFDVNTPNPDASWACYRQIWVISTQQYATFQKGCANITHTASGGGLRSTAIGTIRAHAVAGTVFAPSNAPGSDCALITSELRSRSAPPLLAAPAPTEAVANLQVTAVDDTSASVTWDAVEHATSYDVSWSAESSDALNASAGDLPGITGTTTTIDHGASVPMTLTVTVTPEYVDENGDTVQLDDLGATATLEVGPGSDALRAETQSSDTQSTQSAVTQAQRLEAAKLCVSDTLMEKTKRYYEINRNKAPGYGANWFAILTAFGERTQADWTADSRSIEPMSSASSRERESKWSGWKPFTEALECVETELAKVQAAAQAEAQAEAKAQAAPQELPDDLTVTVQSADSASGVTEGAQVNFTLAADTAPTQELEVTVTVTQTGDVVSATGERTVTIPVGQTEAAFTVATIADDTDEVQGSVTATVSDGTGYKTEDQSASVTVAVKDDDATSITLSANADDLTEIYSEASSEKTLTVTLGRTLIEGESIEVPLVFTGTASLGSDYELSAPKTAPTGVSYANLGGSDPAKSPTVTFAGSTGGVSSLTATLTLTTVADSKAEDDKETVTVKLGTPAATGLGGGVLTSGNVQFSILEPVPEISISAKTQSVAEGTDAVFTVTANRSSGSDLSVNLTVSESDGSDFVAADKEGTAKVTITKGETEADFSVPTVNDSVNEPDGAVTVTVVEDGEKGQYYSQASSPKDSASIKITDNDSVATVPEFSVADETANENVGLMYFTVRLNRSLSQKVQVTFNVRESSPVSARMGQDYFWWWEDGLALTFYPGQTQKKMWVYVYNDNHDEDPETFEVVLSNPTGATAIGDGNAVGTIVNSDPMPAAWLSRFGRTAAQQALDGIAARIASSRTSGIQGSIAGQALVFDPKSKSLVTSGDGQSGTAQNSTANSLYETSSLASFDAQHAFGDKKDSSGNTDPFGYQSYSMTEREALLASSFTATEDKDTSGGSLAFWGQASQSNFDGTEVTFSLDGEATTLMTGTDYARGQWLLGIALMQSKGKGGYRDTDTVKQADLPQCKEESDTTLSEDARKVLCNGAILKGSGDVEATLTAAVPYASFDATERLKVWGALGLGTGDVTLKPNTGGKLSSDISWTMAAGGMRGDVISQPNTGGSGFSLAVKSDVLWARTTSDKTNQLAASDSKVTRLRFGLEGAWTMALDGNGTVTPKLEAGMRHDGGDAESGFGVELGGSVVWTDPTLGMSLDVSGRTLVTHDDDDLKDSGFAASLIWDPKPQSARGPSFTVNLDRGAQAKGGIDALFTPQTLDRRSGTSTDSARWRAEAAYGVAAPGGRYVSSPYMGLGLGAGTREYTLGWKITPEPNAPDVSFGLRTTRTESDSASAHHDVRFEAIARW